MHVSMLYLTQRAGTAAPESALFIAMNRFVINAGREADFETAWVRRKSFLDSVPGFVHFALLKGDGKGEYVSHTTWESRAAFEAWTNSDQFRAGHGQSEMSAIIAGHPTVSLYDIVIEQAAPLAV